MQSSDLINVTVHTITVYYADTDGGSSLNPENYSYNSGTGSIDVSSIGLRTGDRAIVTAVKN